MELTLVMFTEKGERRSFPVTKTRAVIGRNTECDLQISLGMVSRRHCELNVKKDKVMVRDLGSSNGTYVAGKRIQESEISAGETLTIGPVIFTVVINGKPESVKPALTILHRRKKTAERRPEPSRKSDSGTVDLEGSGELEILANDRSGSAVPGELEEPTGRQEKA
jgi:pSer/pThr/pTyr-binding forkhead associated (FHA) protein